MSLSGVLAIVYIPFCALQYQIVIKLEYTYKLLM